MALKPETKFRRNQVDPYIKTLKHCVSFSVQQVTISGTPDKLLCVRGKFVALEIKSEFGLVSALQRYNLEQINLMGGYGLVVTPSNWEDIKLILKQLDEGKEIFR